MRGRQCGFGMDLRWRGLPCAPASRGGRSGTMPVDAAPGVPSRLGRTACAARAMRASMTPKTWWSSVGSNVFSADPRAGENVAAASKGGSAFREAWFEPAEASACRAPATRGGSARCDPSVCDERPSDWPSDCAAPRDDSDPSETPSVPASSPSFIARSRSRRRGGGGCGRASTPGGFGCRSPACCFVTAPSGMSFASSRGGRR
mmetsp:Transcript_15598/g.54450  ORF Transcript_15598/g.54450 Transcript_15598/m.54450 type:complete len:204 (+) Transcript_15598:111-722(+)